MRALLLSLALAAAAPACITPPLVMSGGAPTVAFGPRRVEWGAELVEVALEPGMSLRGVFVPAGAGAPLVLHFLGSSGSVTIPQRAEGLEFDFDELFGALRELGFASLALDYRGVGASDGERDPRNVPTDALAAWNEALRRVDGDSTRITLRGMSLGTLAVASLLERGVEPARVVLFAPVRAETAAANWLRERRGSLAAWFATPFLARPMRVDLLAALERSSAPLTVVVGLRDALLPPRERTELVALVRARGGALLELDLDHLRLVHAAYRPVEFTRGAWGEGPHRQTP